MQEIQERATDETAGEMGSISSVDLGPARRLDFG